jgi:hypothetical protein
MAATKAHPHLTTFHVSDVEPKQVKKYNNVKGDKSEHIALQLDIYTKANCGKILQGTAFPKENILSSENGFVYAATRAYNGHHHLILRPDDIWLSIMTQFSFYINARAEEFRDKFVSFDGKKELTVSAVGESPF